MSRRHRSHAKKTARREKLGARKAAWESAWEARPRAARDSRTRFANMTTRGGLRLSFVPAPDATVTEGDTSGIRLAFVVTTREGRVVDYDGAAVPVALPPPTSRGKPALRVVK